MRRRDLIAGVGSLAVLAGGGVVATQGLPSAGDGGDDADRGDYSDDPIEIETVDAPGSEAGTMAVPQPGQVMVLDFFMTTCGVCQDMMPVLAEARAALDDDNDVRFLSVTHERSIENAELAEWWADYDGDWSVGRDESVDLFERYGVTGVPETVVIDGAGDVHWNNTGRKTVEELVDAVDGTVAAIEEPTDESN
ncbi:TlpA family protein disulfide reductase [Natrialbaceae archaeon AArc-T1-2]|uniref:TlpA family protein disulfide reductase n=1 Tax=Natrialbaceae archaeon AArc-T1-2 TaxID=3053904 RepID=UPI00255A7DB8|nr:TlpA disulfide reductase family protein [Natrialbaceae archaeon AArc-T1-2]WIV67072.1 TlpA disulfide reductase family protein [Natrialbaceae archaeon AArc-T1-2]